MFRVRVSGLGFIASRFRMGDSGFRIKGLGFRV